MKTFKKVLTRILIVIILIVLLYVGLIVWVNRDNLPFLSDTVQAPEISTDWLETEIAGISEYATLEYRYTNVSKFTDTKNVSGWRLPFTNKSFAIKYDGTMKLGIDGTLIKVAINGKNIVVSLPEAKILSHVIQEDSMEVFDQTKNIFNQIEIEDYSHFATEQKAVMEQKALAEGVFDDANEKAKEQIGGFISNLPTIKDEYTISFKIIPNPVEASTAEPSSTVESSAPSEESGEASVASAA